MYFTITQLSIAAVCLVLLLVIVFVVGCVVQDNANIKIITYASGSGSSIKIKGKYHKILPTNRYRELVAQADKNGSWDWQYSNGKQR